MKKCKDCQFQDICSPDEKIKNLLYNNYCCNSRLDLLDGIEDLITDENTESGETIWVEMSFHQFTEGILDFSDLELEF